ncbi:type II toxin-antitoxin system VapC family toxin [Roseobacter sp.]|uniref:type II toxin-antitoxin system VapC family toxin n=1 Tax=Roseobacter sp. TaxID=1907202 RepID=UPI00385F59E9
MIILDTNVVCDPMKETPSDAVISWLNARQSAQFYTTTITLFEIRYGIERLPDGKRKSALWKAFDFTLGRLCGNRILPFDRTAAEALATMLAEAKAYDVKLADAQIAAIAKTHGFSVATRDVKPFEFLGVEIINPWDAGA